MTYTIVEVHDVTPFYNVEFLNCLELLENLRIDKFSICVIPNFREDIPLINYLDFVRVLKHINAEIVLHGYTHVGEMRLKDILWTYREGEFSKIGHKETLRKIDRGMEMMKNLGLATKIFVPPAWIGNPFLEEVLNALGFDAVGYRWHIKDLKRGTKVQSPVLTLSSRPFMGTLSLRTIRLFAKIVRRKRLIRVALHTSDFRYPKRIGLWNDILISVKQTRRFITYGEFLRKSRSAPSLQGF